MKDSKIGKRNIQRIMTTLLTLIFISGLSFAVFFVIDFASNIYIESKIAREIEKLEKEEKNEVEDLIINTKDESTSGSVKIKDNDGNIVYEYYGQFSIRNNGVKGKKVEVVIEGKGE